MRPSVLSYSGKGIKTQKLMTDTENIGENS